MSVWTKRLSALGINVILLTGIMVFMLLLMEEAARLFRVNKVHGFHHSHEMQERIREQVHVRRVQIRNARNEHNVQRKNV